MTASQAGCDMNDKLFSGFPREMFTFLDNLSKNNNRTWFNDHKVRYEQFVVEPTMQFINAVGNILPSISKYYVASTRRTGGSMFRIYRDTRFSPNKRPYKENVGCQFRHIMGRDAHAPGFYVHLAPKEVFIGGGIWMPKNPVLDKVRAEITESPRRWSRVINDKQFLECFGGLGGESLVRPPRGYNEKHPYIDDLKRKSFIAFRHVDPALVLNHSFIDEVNYVFTRLKPLMRFISSALELPF